MLGGFEVFVVEYVLVWMLGFVCYEVVVVFLYLCLGCGGGEWVCYEVFEMVWICGMRDLVSLVVELGDCEL